MRPIVRDTVFYLIGFVMAALITFATKPPPSIPCLTTPIPEIVKFGYYFEPDFHDIIDDDGKETHVVTLTLDPELALSFLGYVTQLEKLVKTAEKCQRPSMKP